MNIKLKKGDLYTVQVYNPVTKNVDTFCSDYDPMFDGENFVIDTSKPLIKIRQSGEFNYLKITRGNKTLWERES